MTAPESTVVTGRLIHDGEMTTGWVEVTGDRISALGPGAPPDLVASDPIAGSNPESKSTSTARIEAGDGWILPGLVDIHAHGGGGWSLEDGVDAARQAAAFHGSRGTTSLVASLVSGPRSHLLATVSELAPWCTTTHWPGCTWKARTWPCPGAAPTTRRACAHPT